MSDWELEARLAEADYVAKQQAEREELDKALRDIFEAPLLLIAGFARWLRKLAAERDSTHEEGERG